MTQPNEPTPPNPGTAPVQPQPTPQPGGTPPWGDAANFDAEKAWTLIQNLRTDNEKHKIRVTELTGFETKLREIEDAQKSEIERATDRATAAEKAAADSAAETLRLRTALKHGISDEDAALFLTGTTAEQLEAQAARLAAMRTPLATPAGTPPGRPVESLRPGSLPTPPPATLQEQIAAAETAGNWVLARRLKNQLLINTSANQ